MTEPVETTRPSTSRGPRGEPFHCPFCGEGDLWPHEAAHGSWECRSCLRAFSLKFLGLVRPGGDRT